MQNTNKAQQGQSFLDLVLQQTGDFKEIIKAAVDNDFSLTDDLQIGSEIFTEKKENEAVGYLAKKKPATAINNTENYGTKKLGIGYMQIGSTFKVS